jgi:hypothetical protein
MGTANAVLHGSGALIPDTSARRISYTAAPDCLLAKPTVLVHHLASGKCNGHCYNRQHECGRVAVSVDYSAFVRAVVRHQQAPDDVPEKAEEQSRSLSGPSVGRMTGKLNKITLAVLATNLGVWGYFWIAFAQASEPYNPHPWTNVPVDLYSFWGHAIGQTQSPYMHPFMNLMFWAEFPSMALVTLIQRVFFSKASADAFLLGISTGGYKLLAIMLLSFLQWYLIGKGIQRLTKRGPVSSPAPAGA